MKKLLASLVLLVGLAPLAHAWPNTAITAGQNITSASAGNIRPAGPDAYSGNLVNEAGLSYSSTYLLDMAQYNAREVSVQVVFSTITPASVAFTDGRQSVGSMTVISYADLKSASAVDHVTLSNQNLSGATLTVGNSVLLFGRDWLRGSTTHATAVNLAAAITLADSRIATIASGSIVYATATAGSYANSLAVVSNNSNMVVNTATFLGGADNAVLTIGGIALTQGTNWTAATSNAATANSIAVAINAATSLSIFASSATGSAIVYTTSTLNGAAYNYAYTSSSPTALSVSGSAMQLGATPGDVLNGKTITATAATGLTPGQAILYQVGSTPALGGLTTGTTYYAAPVGTNAFKLALYSTSAVAGIPAGDFVTITSTNSGTTAHTYTLLPSPWGALTGTYIWQVSNDAATWSTAPSTGTVTISATVVGSPLSTNWGVLGYRYLRLNYTAPALGTLALQVPVYLKKD